MHCKTCKITEMEIFVFFPSVEKELDVRKKTKGKYPLFSRGIDESINDVEKCLPQ